MDTYLDIIEIKLWSTRVQGSVKILVVWELGAKDICYVCLKNIQHKLTSQFEWLKKGMPGFNVYLWYQCSTLTNWAMKPLLLEQVSCSGFIDATLGWTRLFSTLTNRAMKSQLMGGGHSKWIHQFHFGVKKIYYLAISPTELWNHSCWEQVNCGETINANLGWPMMNCSAVIQAMKFFVVLKTL